MNPTIRDGETVVVEPVRALEVLRGDIILYRQASRVVAHRVISLKGSDETHRVFILRGDALIGCDEPVRAEQILGRIVAVEREGRCVNLVKQGNGLARGAHITFLRLKALVRSMYRRLFLIAENWKASGRKVVVDAE